MSTEQPSPQPTPILPGDATERLMRMLDSVRLEKPESTPTSPPSGTQRCPQCRSPEPWGAASWCPNCGYYPKLGRKVTPSELESNVPTTPSASYRWAAWLVLGGVACIALSIASMWIIPDPVARAEYGRLQFIAGLLMVLIGQVMAYVVCARDVDDLPVSAIFFEPVQLWLAVLKNLPDYRHTLYVGTWGGLCMILAVFVTGMNFDGMFAHLKTKKSKGNPLQTLVKMVTAFQNNDPDSSEEEESQKEEEASEGSLLASAGGRVPQSSAGDLESAINDLAGTAAGDLIDSNAPLDSNIDPNIPIGSGDQFSMVGDVEKELEAIGEAPLGEAANPPHNTFVLEKEVAPVAPSGVPRKEESRLVVFGYLTNVAGEIRSLLLADVSTTRPRYAGKLSLEELSEDERAQIQALLDSIRSRKAALPVPFHARWVHPLLIARVAHSGRTTEGHLKEGYLMSIDDTYLRKNAVQASASPVE